MKTLVLALTLLATPAVADDFVYFHSPTGNIACALMSGEFAGARCDMRSLTQSFPKRPVDCELDWGDSFAIAAGARQGVVLCHGDTVMDPNAMVLGYEQSATLGEITCTSETSGMTCLNAKGHGFSIAKAAQHLF